MNKILAELRDQLSTLIEIIERYEYRRWLRSPEGRLHTKRMREARAQRDAFIGPPAPIRVGTAEGYAYEPSEKE